MRISLWVAVVIASLTACNSDVSKPLPDIAFKVKFAEHRIPKEMAVGQKVTSDVTFSNASERKWPSKPNPKRRHAVNLAYHWLDKKGEMVVYDGLRTPLPHDLEAGGTMQLKMAIHAPDRAGDYILQVMPVQEGVAWFSEKGGTPLEVLVHVVDGKTQAASANSTTPPEPAASVKPVKEFVAVADAAKENPILKVAKTSSETDKPSNRASTATPAKPEAAVSGGGGWSVQVASFDDLASAEKHAERLRTQSHDAHVATGTVNGKAWYRVRIGRLPNQAEAKVLQDQLRRQAEFRNAFIAAP